MCFISKTLFAGVWSETWRGRDGDGFSWGAIIYRGLDVGCFLFGAAGCSFCHPIFYSVTSHGWFPPSFFTKEMPCKFLSFLHPLDPIIHLSFVHSNALKIAAITGNPKNSTLLAAQPGANQGLHLSNASYSLEERLPYLSPASFCPHCFLSLGSFGFVPPLDLLLGGDRRLASTYICSDCVLSGIAIHLIN